MISDPIRYSPKWRMHIQISAHFSTEVRWKAILLETYAAFMIIMVRLRDENILEHF
jgi:hypothetical protein